jgi:hypothetical protein
MGSTPCGLLEPVIKNEKVITGRESIEVFLESVSPEIKVLPLRFHLQLSLPHID